jgi:hypothetical protein
MCFVHVIFSVIKSVEPDKSLVILVNVRCTENTSYLLLVYLATTFIQVAKLYKIA